MSTIEMLNDLGKNVYGESFNLIPDKQEKLMNIVKTAPAGKVGSRFEVMAALDLDHSTTFHGSSGQYIDLDDVVEGTQARAYVTPSAMSFPVTLAQFEMDRLVGNATAFENAAEYKMDRARRSFAKVLEAVHNHGGKGLGQFSVVAGNVVTITDATWATALWIGGKSKPIDIYNAATGAKVLSTSISTVDTITKQMTLASAVGLANGTLYDIYARNSKGRESLGLFKILSVTSGELFGIDASDYDLWKANQKALGNKDLDWAAFASAVAENAGRGIYGGGYSLLMNSIHFPKMIPNFNTAKNGAKVDGVASTFPANHSAVFTTPGAVSRISFGTESLSFVVNDVECDIVTSEYVKRGEAAMINKECIMRVVASDKGEIKMIDSGAGQWKLLEKKAAYEARLYTDQALFIPELNRHLLFTGINASSLV